MAAQARAASSAAGTTSKGAKKSSASARTEQDGAAPVKRTATKSTTSKSTTTRTAAKKTAPKKPRSRLSAADRKEFGALIAAELERIRAEYDSSMDILDALRTSGQDSAGDDPADAGTKTFEREQEMSLANNRLDLITQMERAMTRLQEGTYGVCESCGELIPKGRLQAFPQATLCVACKSRQERR